MTLRLAYVGTGGIFKGGHMPAVSKLTDKAELVAVCDVDEGRARAAAAKHGGAAYTDLERMLDRAKPDAVVLCTPQMVRLDPISACCRRKIPFLTEKPPANDADTAKRIIEMVQKAGVVNSVGFLYRYYTVTQQLRTRLAKDCVGLVRGHYNGDVATNPIIRKERAWFLDKAVSGGLVVDQAIHLLDIQRYLMGEVEAVFAAGANRIAPRDPVNKTEDTVVVSLQFANGCVGGYEHTWAHKRWNNSLEFYSEQNHYRVNFAKQKLEITDPQVRTVRNCKDDGFMLEIGAFLEAIDSGRSNGILSSFADAAQTLALTLAINRSLETGKVEKVEPLV